MLSHGNRQETANSRKSSKQRNINSNGGSVAVFVEEAPYIGTTNAAGIPARAGTRTTQ